LKKKPLNDILIVHNTNYKYDHGYHLAPIKQMFFQIIDLDLDLQCSNGPIKKKLRFKRDEKNIQGLLEDRSNKGTKNHDHENFVSSRM
jgi:hypothetical protein